MAGIDNDSLTWEALLEEESSTYESAPANDIFTELGIKYR